MTTDFSPIDDRHAQEFTDSAIAQEISALNFRSFNGENENELDEAFTLLIEDPNHNNNGTLAGKSPNDLANTLRSGGWIFEGYKGVCVKPNSSRKVKDENGKEKDIKYESPRGDGKLQLFIPRVSVRVGLAIASKLGEAVEKEYRQRIELLAPGADDPIFWDWYLEHDGFIIITEGAKKACSLVSNGYPAIGLNGIWGCGTNVKDMFGNVEKDERGKSIKTIHPDLELFLDGREIVLALDREATPDKVKTVEAAKAAFVRAIDGEELTVTDLKWKSPKGIDDYIAAKGVKALDRLYANRKEFKPPEPPKPERVTSGDTLLEIGKTATYFHTADKVPYADIWIEGNRHTYAVRSKAFRMWLSGEFYKSEGKGIGSQTLQDTHKLAVAATRRHLMVYDNVSHISPDQSDDLCRIATGFGFSTRTLHTTDEETTFELTRPQIITAIDALVTRDDLADRVLMAQLPEIPAEKRLPQGELNAKVEAARPRILGALLTALSQTLAQPRPNPATLPRMADYALFAIASEKALGLKKGEFMETFNESREQSRQIVIESSPVGEAIVRLMEKTPLVWKGTASELLNELEKHTDEATYRSRYFPKASNSLSRQLTRLAPDLKALGIEVGYFRAGQDRNRLICLEKVVKISSIPSIPSIDGTKATQDNGLNEDDIADDTRTISNVTDDIADGITNTDDTRTIPPSYIVRPESSPGQRVQPMADGMDGMDDKKSLSSKQPNKVIDSCDIPEATDDEF